MTTLADCIEEAKVCLSICQPSSLVSRMSTLTVTPSETDTPVQQHSPSPVRRNQILIYKTDKVDKDRDHPFLKGQHFKVSDNTQVMSDLIPCQIQAIFLPTLDLDQLQDLFPDLNLEISINQLNVTIVTTWVTQQTIVSDIRIEMLHVDNLTKAEEAITEILKGIQITGQTLDTGHLTPLHIG